MKTHTNYKLESPEYICIYFLQYDIEFDKISSQSDNLLLFGVIIVHFITSGTNNYYEL